MGHEPSFEELSALERSGIEKGLKFSIAPRKIPTAETVAEESISQLNDERRNLVRAEVTAHSGVLNLLPKTFKRMFSMRL